MKSSSHRSNECLPQELLEQTKKYLACLQSGRKITGQQETSWKQFYELCAKKIRKFACCLNIRREDLPDCMQEVWRELLVRLPGFKLDSTRGQFDTWLYTIVRSKVADLYRSDQNRPGQGPEYYLTEIFDKRPDPEAQLEDKEILTIALEQIRHRLTDCNYQILQQRLINERPVAEVAEAVGLRCEQIRYRCHRAKRQLKTILTMLHAGNHFDFEKAREKTEEFSEYAQRKAPPPVSPYVRSRFLLLQGCNSMAFVFKRLELGRQKLVPQWKVEWSCEDIPKPVFHIRKLSMVAYAEICGPEELTNSIWPEITKAAINAGVAAGIASIIAARQGSKTLRIRFFGVDCPESDQPYGPKAAAFTSGMVKGKVVTVKVKEKDRYGRYVGEVLFDGKSVNRELVRAGLGWWYERYAKDDLDLQRLEQRARQTSSALWSQQSPIAPWIWRRDR